MPLTPPAERIPLHTRAVVYRGYHRADGHWDIEAELTDTKAYRLEGTERGDLPPGTPIHAMLIRATVDDDLVIQAIESSTGSAPFDECQQGGAPMQRMVGVKMGPGWRQAIERALGGVKGCTHLRELLFNMATAAYQTIPVYQWRLRREAGRPVVADGQPPYHLGRCLAWDFNGPVVARLHPEFAGWQPLVRSPKETAGG